MGDGPKIRIAEHIEIEWLSGAETEAACPNCGARGMVRPLLDIDYRPPGLLYHFVMLACPECGARFVDNDEMMDYGAHQLIEFGEHGFQVQIGTGLWPIASQLALIDKPAGARAMEIGGSYGFGLDFCIRARGWQGVGFDPSPLTEFGARELGLDLRQDYFEEKDLALGRWDVIVAIEVLEHLPRPPEFLRLMRRAIAEDGILLLTTPDAAHITPERSAGELMPLLSPGSHMVLQTAESLARALRDAGFTHVEVRRSGLSLTAFASPSPFRLNDDLAAARAMYRRYLSERAALAAPESDARLGFAGRGVFEAANDGDWAAAEAAWQALLPAAKLRFGLDLETMTALPHGAAALDMPALRKLMAREDLAPLAQLAHLAHLMPLGLGMVFLGRSMQRLVNGAPRAEVAPMLRLGKEAVDALQNALAQRSIIDALSSDIAKVLEVELLLCDAGDGRTESLEALAARGDEALAWRAFVALVNDGKLGPAARLRARALPEWPGADIEAGLRRNALLCLVNFHLTAGGDTLLALPYAKALAGTDPSAIGPLYAGIFVRLINKGDYARARRLDRDHGVEWRLAYCDTAQRLDAQVAFLLLDMQPDGQAAKVPARLDELLKAGLPEARAVPLALAAFTALVNRGEFSAARTLLKHVEPILIRLRPPYADGERDALFTAGILYLQEKDDWRRASATLARLRDALVKRAPPGGMPDPLFWPALRGEILALHRLERGAEASALLQTYIGAYDGAPDDLRAQIKTSGT